MESTSANFDRGTIESDVTFHQPKMPPIPEDAVILSDYMLMADFVGVTGTSGGIGVISKGTRFLTATRDVLWDENTNDAYTFTFATPTARAGNYQSMTSGNISSGEAFGKVPYFGTTVDVLPYADRFTALTEPLNSTSITTTSVSTTTWSGRQRASGQTLGMNEIKVNKTTGNFTIQGFEISSPIHTSSHYQTFETPFLHELVGGDRNMEQTNLVVTPDGKTWDQVTRDVSYIGSLCVRSTHNLNISTEIVHIYDEWRGYSDGTYSLMNKDFAISYDRVICLKGGEYQIFSLNIVNEQDREHCQIFVNGTKIITGFIEGSSGYNNETSARATLTLRRDDYIQIVGSSGAYNQYTTFEITRM